jgi:hypothetical protein
MWSRKVSKHVFDSPIAALISAAIATGSPAVPARAATPPIVTPAVAQAAAKANPPKKVFKSKYGYKTFIANHGGQAEIDEETGGLTEQTKVTQYLGKPLYSIHNEAGGKPILDLKPGDLVKIGNQEYVAVDFRDLDFPIKADQLKGMAGSAILQTCHFCTTIPCAPKTARFVGITKLNP